MVSAAGKASAPFRCFQKTGFARRGRCHVGVGHTCAYWSLGRAQQPGQQSTPDVSNRISCRGLGYRIVQQDGGANGEVKYPAMSPKGKPPWPVAQRTPCSSPDGWSGARAAAPLLASGLSTMCVSRTQRSCLPCPLSHRCLHGS